MREFCLNHLGLKSPDLENQLRGSGGPCAGRERHEREIAGRSWVLHQLWRSEKHVHLYFVKEIMISDMMVAYP